MVLVTEFYVSRTERKGSMRTSTPSTKRTILAWLVGILAWYLIVILESRIEFLHENMAHFALMVLEIMIAARFGMAVRAGKLDGGLSKRGKRRFNRWIAVIIALGVFGGLVDVLLAGISRKRPLLMGTLFFIGPLALFILLMQLAEKFQWIDDTFGRILKWIKKLDLIGR